MKQCEDRNFDSFAEQAFQFDPARERSIVTIHNGNLYTITTKPNDAPEIRVIENGSGGRAATGEERTAVIEKLLRIFGVKESIPCPGE